MTVPDPASLMPATDARALRALAESTQVAEIMSADVVCLPLDAPIEGVIEMFLDKDLSCAPVVDAAWRPLGMVTKTDLLRQFEAAHRARLLAAEGGPPAPSTSVGQVTTPYVVSVVQDASLSVAAALMAQEGVHCLPIVAATGEVVGVVSTLDLVRWLARKTGMPGE